MYFIHTVEENTPVIRGGICFEYAGEGMHSNTPGEDKSSIQWKKIRK
jgi:hypothetical protein